MNRYLIFITVIIIWIMGGLACKPKSSFPPQSIPSASQEIDSTVSTNPSSEAGDTTVMYDKGALIKHQKESGKKATQSTGEDRDEKVDTLTRVTDVDNKPVTDVDNKVNIRSAVLGYSFFKNIQQHETRNITAYVSIINAISHVIDTLKEINAANIPERSNDTATIIAKNIFVFKALDIRLINPGDSDFIITAFSDNRQVIDSSFGNSWTWSVTPRTYKSHGRLIMNVIAEKPDGSHEPFSIVEIPINIIIDKEITRSLWQWMMDNPEKVLTIILIPLIIFFRKQIGSLFKKKADH